MSTAERAVLISVIAILLIIGMFALGRRPESGDPCPAGMLRVPVDNHTICMLPA